MRTLTHRVPVEREDAKATLDRHLDDFGWGLLFVLAGAVWLTPAEVVPWGAWVIGFGAILLAVNLVRQLNGIAVHLFSAGLGGLAALAGAGDLLGIDIPIIGLGLVAIGGGILYRTWRRSVERR